jgi:hypothetical protein
MLQRTLAEFTLYDERIGDIINLLRYSYSNTTDRSESIDDLRLLVVHYSACVVEDLSRSNEFQLLLEEVGERGHMGHLQERAGENSTSGPQPYQPYEGGDYHLPYFQQFASKV